MDGALEGVQWWSLMVLLSESGRAFTSNEFEAVCIRLQLDHKPMESPKGESYLHSMG